jgi:hypothetical protein
MNQQDFLLECGKSYLDVLAALGYFRAVVQERCDHVVRKHSPVLAEVLGVKAGDLKWSQYSAPDKPSSAAVESASLGWRAKRQENLYLYFTVCWVSEPDEGELPINVQVDLWFKDRKKASDLAARLDDLCDQPPFADQTWEFGSDGQTLIFWIGLEETEFSLFDEKLDQLLVLQR